MHRRVTTTQYKMQAYPVSSTKNTFCDMNRMTCLFLGLFFWFLVTYSYNSLYSQTNTNKYTKYGTENTYDYANNILVMENTYKISDKSPAAVQESPLLKPYMNQCGKLWSSSDCASSMPRLLEYCNIDKPRGSEGDVYNSREHDNSYIRDFELVHLLITIRHGDRTTLNKIAGSDSLNKSIDKYKSSNGPIESKLLEPQVLRHIDSCKKLDLNYTPAVLGQPSHNPLHSSNLFTVPDASLPSGELTSRGYWQHVQLSQHVYKAYSNYLNPIHSSSQIYVRSTNYNRTIQSAAAFLGSLLSKSPLQSKITINVNTYDDDEVMHGVGVKLSSKAPLIANNSASAIAASNHESGGDIVIEGACKKAVTLAKQQSSHISNSPSFDRQIAELFSVEATTRPVSDIADAALPSICHKKKLPCSLSGSSCMTTDLLSEAVREGDRLYCNRYAGSQGGKVGTKLSLYPFLSEILSKLEAVASGESNTKLTLFSGHDTVIAPLLAGLDIYDTSSFLCRWPKYASRIIFELYKSKKPLPSKDRSQPDAVQYKFRITFNGHDVTLLIPACQSNTIQLDTYYGISIEKTRQTNLRVDNSLSNDNAFSSLCDLSQLRSQVESMLQPYNNFQEACQDQSVS